MPNVSSLNPQCLLVCCDLAAVLMLAWQRHTALMWRIPSPCAGEDLLVASADKPFRFPATFTFVVRSFTVLDGIGKGLDPRFDISEIAAPYARSLILEAKPQFAKLQQDFGRRLQTQVG